MHDRRSMDAVSGGKRIALRLGVLIAVPQASIQVWLECDGPRQTCSFSLLQGRPRSNKRLNIFSATLIERVTEMADERSLLRLRTTVGTEADRAIGYRRNVGTASSHSFTLLPSQAPAPEAE